MGAAGWTVSLPVYRVADIDSSDPFRTKVDWTEELDARLIALFHEGHSYSEIARRLRSGTTKNAIIRRSRRLNLPKRPNPSLPREGSGPKTPRTPPRPKPAPLPVISAAALPSEVFTMSGRIRDVQDQRREPLRGATLAMTESAARSLRAQFAPSNMVSYPPDRKCCWPIGEPKKPEFRFCAAIVVVPGPYCSEHRAKAYVSRAVAKVDAA